MPISLVMTVRNEAASIGRLLDTIPAQTLLPDEIVVVDGGSTDATLEVLSSYREKLPLRVISLPGANISAGRNAAIRNARHDILAATDAGVRLDPHWLERLTRPLLEDESVSVVSGFFLPDPQTPFELAMGATVLPLVEEIDPDTFLPSSRSVAFRKAAWEAVGGYPKWLDYSEDLVFDMRLKEMGYSFAFAPDALVYFRPRSSLKAFFVQYYRYARGDGKADLWRKRHAIRYSTYVVGPLAGVWGWRLRRTTVGKGILALFLLAAAGYCRRPYLRLIPQLGKVPLLSRLYALSLVPVIRLTGDVAKMLGYPVGVWWRLLNGRSRRD